MMATILKMTMEALLIMFSHLRFLVDHSLSSWWSEPWRIQRGSGPGTGDHDEVVDIQEAEAEVRAALAAREAVF